MTRPARSSLSTKRGPKILPTIHIKRMQTTKISAMTAGAPKPKNATATTGTTPQVDPQGMAQAMATVSMRWPHVSITREPDTPPMVQPKHMRNGMRDFP